MPVYSEGIIVKRVADPSCNGLKTRSLFMSYSVPDMEQYLMNSFLEQVKEIKENDRVEKLKERFYNRQI